MEDEVIMEETTPLDETTSGDDLFTDDEAEEENTTPAEEESEEKPDEKPEEKSEEEIVSLKYLGKNLSVPKSALDSITKVIGADAAATIQKGMDYDRKINNTPLHKIIDKYAEASGMTRDEYVEWLSAHADTALGESERTKVLKQHPDWDDEKVNMQAEINLLSKQKARTEQKATEKLSAEFNAQKPFIEFVQKYPDVKEFPKEVSDDIEKGISPIIAYEAYQQKQVYDAKMAELNTKIEQADTKGKNKAKAAGSMKDNTAGEHDDFLDGLFG